MQTFSLIRLTTVIYIYSILQDVVINGDDDVALLHFDDNEYLYGLRSYNGESKFLHPDLRTFFIHGGVGIGVGASIHGEAGIGEGGFYGGPGMYRGPGAGVHGDLDINAGVNIGGGIGIGREGGIGSDVGFGGTGGRIGKNGGILDSKIEGYLRQSGDHDRFRWG